MPAKQRIALLIRDLGSGGVERCFINLAQGFVQAGHQADLITASRDHPYCRNIDPRIRVTHLEPHGQERLAAHLAESGVDLLLAAKDTDCMLAGLLRKQRSFAWRLAVCSSVNVSAQLKGRRKIPFAGWRKRREVRQIMAAPDIRICVSRGVVNDIAKITGRPPSDFIVLPNPIVTPELADLAREPLDHPWFQPGQPPVILGAGRLARAKNFSLLIDAFARLDSSCPARLVILGQGRYRERLIGQTERLHIADRVDFPGFDANPYRYMARASLFVLSSLWEGFGNVLIESMACGTPVVSTDCPSGPAEILADGRLGRLVAMDDADGMAAAITATLAQPPDIDALGECCTPYTVEHSSNAYLDALFRS